MAEVLAGDGFLLLFWILFWFRVNGLRTTRPNLPAAAAAHHVRGGWKQSGFLLLILILAGFEGGWAGGCALQPAGSKQRHTSARGAPAGLRAGNSSGFLLSTQCPFSVSK